MPCLGGSKLVTSGRILIPTMTLDEAITTVGRHIRRMKEVYRKPVFDEWALVAMLGSKGRALHYEGPRREEFFEFNRDAQAFAADLRRPGIIWEISNSLGMARGPDSTRFSR